MSRFKREVASFRIAFSNEEEETHFPSQSEARSSQAFISGSRKWNCSCWYLRRSTTSSGTMRYFPCSHLHTTHIENYNRSSLIKVQILPQITDLYEDTTKHRSRLKLSMIIKISFIFRKHLIQFARIPWWVINDFFFFFLNSSSILKNNLVGCYAKFYEWNKNLIFLMMFFFFLVSYRYFDWRFFCMKKFIYVHRIFLGTDVILSLPFFFTRCSPRSKIAQKSRLNNKRKNQRKHKKPNSRALEVLRICVNEIYLPAIVATVLNEEGLDYSGLRILKFCVRLSKSARLSFGVSKKC